MLVTETNPKNKINNFKPTAILHKKLNTEKPGEDIVIEVRMGCSQSLLLVIQHICTMEPTPSYCMSVMGTFWKITQSKYVYWKMAIFQMFLVCLRLISFIHARKIQWTYVLPFISSKPIHSHRNLHFSEMETKRKELNQNIH